MDGAYRDVIDWCVCRGSSTYLTLKGYLADIDEQLPTYPDGTLMCMSTGQKRILWPSLVEKAVSFSVAIAVTLV